MKAHVKSLEQENAALRTGTDLDIYRRFCYPLPAGTAVVTNGPVENSPLSHTALAEALGHSNAGPAPLSPRSRQPTEKEGEALFNMDMYSSDTDFEDGTLASILTARSRKHI